MTGSHRPDLVAWCHVHVPLHLNVHQSHVVHAVHAHVAHRGHATAHHRIHAAAHHRIHATAHADTHAHHLLVDSSVAEGHLRIERLVLQHHVVTHRHVLACNRHDFLLDKRLN